MVVAVFFATSLPDVLFSQTDPVAKENMFYTSLMYLGVGITACGRIGNVFWRGQGVSNEVGLDELNLLFPSDSLCF